MKLIYPACVYKDEENGSYEVEIPDIPGCSAEADTLADAIMRGIDAASDKVLDALEDGGPIPKASSLESIHPGDGGFVNLLMLDMNAYAEKSGRSTTRHIQIPTWLFNFAEQNSVDPDLVLRESLTAVYEKQMGRDDAQTRGNLLELARR
ncbi:MAG: type II toxin-antitoxin system HicB family antitoxin [Clostridiales bacterium]|nr:type II toxin-antitoxin system HicB family antitoxin [Clostridiales bacterium]